MTPIYSRFIGGINIQSAINRCSGRSWIPIFDRAREGNKTRDDVILSTSQLIDDISVLKYSEDVRERGFFALKASTFASDRENISHIYRIARDINSVGMDVVLDAELHTDTDVEDYFAKVFTNEQIRFYKTYQMYRIDALKRLIRDIDQGEITRIKLVRGAYYQHEKDFGVLLPSKKHVDHVYDAAVKYVLGEMQYRPELSVMIATHNEDSIRKSLALVNDMSDACKSRVFYAKLLGMGKDVSHVNMCRYVPYGDLQETLPYLGRRLVENYPILMHVVVT